MKPIPYGRQNITQDDIDAVVKVLKSDYLTQGPEIAKFEKEFAEYIGVKYAVAVANGTAALHLCTLALGVKSGDKVITTPITFAASANCIKYAGGDVVFADIDPKTYLLDVKEVEKLLKASPKGTYKGIIPVDFAGRAVDLNVFRKLADEYGCWIIEDACHAPGGYFTDNKGKNHNCGNCDFAELAIFSFHPVKHIAAGEGGMITTNDENIYRKLQLLRTHGITKDENCFSNSFELDNGHQLTANYQWPGWYYEMQELGFNYRLTDFQAALGLSQLKCAKEGLTRRREIATVYEKAFTGKSYINGQSVLIEGHGYHLYIIEVENRKGLYNHLRKNNIFAQVHYIPVHLHPYYKNLGWKKGDFPNAEAYYEKCLSLPMYPSLSDQEQEYVIQNILNFVS
jgi:UDP-4-amino-4,6-dideoxy-N-acetyl-beta-L-altrosamine transaminase